MKTKPVPWINNLGEHGPSNISMKRPTVLSADGKILTGGSIGITTFAPHGKMGVLKDWLSIKGDIGVIYCRYDGHATGGIFSTIEDGVFGM